MKMVIPSSGPRDVVAEVRGALGSLETRTFTIGADGDCITTKTAPIAAELITAGSFVSGKKHCRITMHTDAEAGVPFASNVVATLNAPDDAAAISRLTYVDVTAGGTGSTDTRQRILSKKNPVIEWDLSGTDSDVDRVDMGGWLDPGTGAVAVYLSVEVW